MPTLVQKFLQELIEFKEVINEGKVPKANVDACRPTLAQEWFTLEIMSNKSKAAGAAPC